MKNYKVNFADEAKQELRNAIYYIALDNKEKANALFKEIKTSANKLSDFPDMGTLDHSNGLPFLHIKPYRLYHLVDHANKSVEIITVHHTSRDTYKPSK